MKTVKTWATAASLVVLAGAVHAAPPVFQGRLANGAASSTCTVSGAGKCASFYDTTLDITILNNWNIGKGPWDGSAVPNAISAQALAESAGFAATGLTGWVLPTGDRDQQPGALNQYLSIWNDAGGSLAGLQGHFDQVQSGIYFSRDAYPINGFAWYFRTSDATQGGTQLAAEALFVAVRPGDVIASSVPESQTWALMLAGLSALALAARRRAR